MCSACYIKLTDCECISRQIERPGLVCSFEDAIDWSEDDVPKEKGELGRRVIEMIGINRPLLHTCGVQKEDPVMPRTHDGRKDAILAVKAFPALALVAL